MTEAQDLLARIRELDQDATGGPWKYLTGVNLYQQHYKKVEGKYYVNVARTASHDDGMLIAEYRNETPRMAKALESVLTFLDDYQPPSKRIDPTGETSELLEAFEQTIRKTINDALGGDDD